MNPDDKLEATLAARLLALRQERGFRLSDLADRTGMSIAHLSRLEKGVRQPSIGALLTLARCYDLTLGQLVGEHEKETYWLMRASAGTPMRRTAGETYRVLSGPGLPVSIAEVSIPAGRTTDVAKHPGVEWLYVLSGKIEVSIGSELVALSEGDAVQFDSSLQHQISVSSDETAQVLLASTAVAISPPH